VVGDPSSDKGGDGGRGTERHDSRLWRESRVSVESLIPGGWATVGCCEAAGLAHCNVSTDTGSGRRGKSAGSASTGESPPDLEACSSTGGSNARASLRSVVFTSAVVFMSPRDIAPRGVPLYTGAISTGVTGVRGKDVLDLRTGVHGRFFTGVCGRSGSLTVKDLLNGHSVFSNCRILSKTSRSSCARYTSSSFSTGSSILQYCGRRICKTNLLESSSTHQTWLLGRIGWSAEPQLRKATEPGAR
jgi:hypothetical protein